jgi:hypothetical protein
MNGESAATTSRVLVHCATSGGFVSITKVLSAIPAVLRTTTPSFLYSAAKTRRSVELFHRDLFAPLAAPRKTTKPMAATSVPLRVITIRGPSWDTPLFAAPRESVVGSTMRRSDVNQDF